MSATADMRTRLAGRIQRLRDRAQELRKDAKSCADRADALQALRDSLTEKDEAQIASLIAAEALRVTD